MWNIVNSQKPASTPKAKTDAANSSIPQSVVINKPPLCKTTGGFNHHAVLFDCHDGWTGVDAEEENFPALQQLSYDMDDYKPVLMNDLDAVPGAKGPSSDEAADDGTRALLSALTGPAPTTSAGPRVRVVNGEIIVDETSLWVDTSQSAVPNAADSLNSLTGLMQTYSGATYVNLGEGEQVQAFDRAYKRSKSTKWSTDDTKRFYEAIELFGPDLMLVGSLLPHLTSRQIKDKYKAEEKRNSAKLEKALLSRKKRRAELQTQAFEKVHGRISDASKDYKVSEPGSTAMLEIEDAAGRQNSDDEPDEADANLAAAGRQDPGGANGHSSAAYHLYDFDET